jgi:tRNA-uridine 2-sulfurtransferase
MAAHSGHATGRRIVVAMSGGVDSSVAAALLVEQGYDVIGVTIKTFCYSDSMSPGKTCCGLDGIIDARRVAGALDIPHYVFDMEESFTRTVIDDFVSEYAAGRTPNPCVRCNSNTKIPHLLERARRLGAELIATGHYARRIESSHGLEIRRGLDRNKDQTYFLWAVPKPVMARLHFPVGDLTKPQVRDRARALGLVTADKPESQEICFVPTNDYTDLLGRRLGPTHPALSEGEMVTSEGVVVGRHGGYGRYTVGQRRGLGGGRGAPLYVLGVRPATNQVVVGEGAELWREDVTLSDLNWLEQPPVAGERIRVQVRHRAADIEAEVVLHDGGRLKLQLCQAQRAVTPGQSGAVYRGNRLIGGGRIV